MGLCLLAFLQAEETAQARARAKAEDGERREAECLLAQADEEAEAAARSADAAAARRAAAAEATATFQRHLKETAQVPLFLTFCGSETVVSATLIKPQVHMYADALLYHATF